MKRREFIAALGVAAAWPRVTHAQQDKRMRRIAVLLGSAESDAPVAAGLAAFRKGLQELGWTEGRNIQIDVRWAAYDVDRMHLLAKELVSQQPDLIVGQITQVVAALQRETTKIPIVFVVVGDPIGSGFVSSLAHPGGNITGLINIESSLAGKWVELLKDVVPRLTRAMLIFNPEITSGSAYYVPPFEASARSFAVEPITAPVRSAADIERTIASLGDGPTSGLVLCRIPLPTCATSI